MSTPEQHAEGIDLSRSKVKVSRNAKGEPQWEISVVAGEEESEVNRLKDVAIAINRALEEEFRLVRDAA